MACSTFHVFRIGSVTKQFAAAAALKLAEAGKLSLEDPLTKFVPGYPGGERVVDVVLVFPQEGDRPASVTLLQGGREVVFKRQD